jgi:transcriptional regulator with XRE-family HTH domain
VLTIADRIRYLREASGLSQKKFGEVVGLSDGFVSLLETGGRAGMGYDKARIVAEASGTTVDWVLGGHGEGPARGRVARSVAKAAKARGVSLKGAA